MDLFRSICVFVICVLFEGSVFCKVVITPVNASVVENDSVTLTCALTENNKTASIDSAKWFLINQTMLQNVGSLRSSCKIITKPYGGMYDFACPNSTHVTCTVKKVTRQHHGNRYLCQIRPLFKNQIFIGEAFLYVKVPLVSVSMVVPSTSNVSVVENTEHVFKCKTSGCRPAATVTWYKDPGTPGNFSDDVEITSNIETLSSNADTLTEVNSTLRYSPAKNDMGYRIYCTGSNILSRDPVVSKGKPLLNVLYPPVIGELKNITVVEGSSLTVSWPVILGNPPETTFQWKRNDHVWKTTQNFTIDTISKTDAIFYTCVVANMIEGTGEQELSRPDSKSLHLNVLYKASVTIFKIEGHHGQPNAYLAEHDSKIQFTCVVDCNPLATIKIMFDGNILKEESNTTSLSYTRSNVACLNSGVYVCEGYNNYSHQSSKNLTSLSVTCSSATSSCNAKTSPTDTILRTTLGIVCVMLAVYAASITILYRRKASKDEPTSNEPRAQTNLNITESHGSQEEARQNNGDENDTARQYIDLVQYSNDDQPTYEVIQAAN